MKTNRLDSNLNGFRETFLHNFLSMSTWQSAVAVLAFLIVTGAFWFGLKKIKIKFVYRVLIGMLIGLIFGVTIQTIIGFPGGGWFNSTSDSVWIKLDSDWIDITNRYFGDEKISDIMTNPADLQNMILLINGNISLILDSANGSPIFSDFLGTHVVESKQGILWIYEFNVWAQLVKRIFINGILLITVPVVFISIFRVVARPGGSRLASISGKGAAILLLNVAIAFTITFLIGYFLNIGGKFNFDSQISGEWSGTSSTALPNIVSGYVSPNLLATLSGTAIVPVIVLAAIFGTATKYVRKKQPKSMDNLLNFMDRAWDIIISVLMMFMKIMPIAVVSMLTTAITTRAIGALSSLGLILAIGYLGSFIMLGLMTLVLFIKKINIFKWWKYAWRPFVQGFSTQSSNATLPITIDTLENDMKIKSEVSSVIAPISTSLGLVACAGVQAGLITSVLYTGSDIVGSMNIFAYFLIALFTTIIASIGIAGVPGTATVVTSAVLNGIGFGAYFAPVYSIFGPIDGLFDMARTATNITGGVFASTIVAKDSKNIESYSEILLFKPKDNQVKEIKKSKNKKMDKTNSKLKNVKNTKEKA